MIIGVSSTNGGWIHASLSGSSQIVRAVPGSGTGGQAGEGLEVQPKLADVIRNLVDGEFTSARRRWGVGAGIPVKILVS